MAITIIGAGYVGLITGVGLAKLGHQVNIVDTDPTKIEKLNSWQPPIYELGLNDLLQDNEVQKRLHFSGSLDARKFDSDIYFIAVGTPTKINGRGADVSYVEMAAEQIANVCPPKSIIVLKSTVPVGTNDKLQKQLDTAFYDKKIAVISNPEFLKEGAAVFDFFNPDRIVLGGKDSEALRKIGHLYQGLNRPGAAPLKLLAVDWQSAELIKYGSNALLAVRLSFINEMAAICENSNADIIEVAKGIGQDSRIGAQFLNAGPGWGGVMLPKRH